MARVKPFTLGLIVALLLVGVPVALNKPRGLRTRNPLNLKKIGNWRAWLGLDPVQDDPVNVKYISDFYGLRAGAYVLLKYQKDYGLFNLAGILNKWAPATDTGAGVPAGGNKPNEYAAAVAKAAGVTAVQPINLRADTRLFVAVVKGMVRFENGSQPYTDKLITEAINAAKEAVPA